MENGAAARHLRLVPAPQRQGWGDFPLRVFPRWAQTWCEQLATELQFSLDLPAMGLLGVTAGAVGNAVRIWRNQQWVERATLWVAVAYPSGEHKSAARARFVAPIEEFEQRQERSYLERLVTWMDTCAQLAEEIARLNALLRELRQQESKLSAQILLEEDAQKRQELWERRERIRKGQRTTLEQLAEVKARHQVEQADAPIRRRVLINDSTPVALIRFLGRNRGQGLVLDSEAP